MGIDAVARLLSVSAQKLMKGAYGIDRRILGGGLKPAPCPCCCACMIQNDTCEDAPFLDGILVRLDEAA